MEQPPRPKRLGTLAFSAALFVGFYLYTWLVIDPSLLYESPPGFPVFFTGWTFLRAAATRYGGPLEYVSGFLGQSYCFPWLGALVIALITGLACLALDVLVLAIGGNHVRFVALIPAVIVLVGQNYHFNQLTSLLGLLVALACAALYARAPIEKNPSRVVLFVVVGVPLYCAVGGPFLLFAALAGIYELLGRQRRLPALVALLSIEVVPYVVGAHVFQVDLTSAYAYHLPYHAAIIEPGGAAMVWAYVLPPTFLLVIGVSRLVAAHRAVGGEPASSRARTAAHRSRPRLRTWPSWAKLQPATGWVLLVVIGTLTVFVTYDGQRTTVLRMDRYADHRMWGEILRSAQGLSLDHYNALVMQHVNEALYHTGRLPYEMFSYPQRIDGLLLDMTLSHSREEGDRRADAVRDLYFRIGDLDLRLGLVNEAEHEAHEALEIHGEQGSVLRRLALINIAKEQPDAARVFLRALQRSVVYRHQAQDLLQRLKADPFLSSDPEVRRIRSVMLVADETRFDLSGELGYQALLQRNPRNRMAFEYLMAFYLLTRDLDHFAANLPRLRDFDYPDIPRHYQEAILLYERDTSKRADRCGYHVGDDVLRQFPAFSRELDFAGTPAMAAHLLRRQYGNTYFYYYVTGLSGLGGGRSEEKR